jgi:hypothetical protein
VAGIGDPIRTVDAYLQNVSGLEPEGEKVEVPEEDGEDEAELKEEERWGSGEVLLSRVALTDGRGGDLVAVGTGTPATIELDVKVREPLNDFVFGIGIYHADGTCVYGTNTDLEGLFPAELSADGTVRFDISSLDLVAGSYRIDAAVHSRNGRAYDYRRGAIRFVVGSRIHDVGVYRPKHEWKFDGGIHFKTVDVLERNVPAPMAEYIKESEANQPRYRRARPRKKKE